MDKSFLAYRIHLTDGKIRGKLETLNRDELKLGDILVRVEYSGINYKDALAATGAGRVLREFPLIGGVDLAGEVLESSVARFHPGDKVLAINCGQSETRDGGYTELARVNGECALHIPETMDTRTVMALGTAGFTAALAVHRMEEHGQRPELGPIVVTGATGGVGSIAIDLFSARGYQVTALTGKAEQHGYLESLGATETIDRKTLKLGTKPLEHARWGGAVDNLGGEILAWLTRTVKPWGNIASIGLAASMELQTTVMPFILRGVNLLGINMEVGRELRASLWERLGSDLKPHHLDQIVAREVSLSELPECFDAYMSGSVIGRTLVRVQK